MMKVKNLFLTLTLTSPLCFANINDLKVDTIKSMYAQSKFDLQTGKWKQNSASDSELLSIYGTAKLKRAMENYEKYDDMDCAETYPSLHINEQRDDLNKVIVNSMYVLPNGSVRVNLNAYSMNSSEVVKFTHDYSMVCNMSQCQISDVQLNGDYSLVEAVNASCKP